MCWRLKILHKIGKHSKLFRRAYYKLSKGKYLWGIIGFIRDYGQRSKYKEPYTYNDAGAEWLEELIERIFAFEDEKKDA